MQIQSITAVTPFYLQAADLDHEQRILQRKDSAITTDMRKSILLKADERHSYNSDSPSTFLVVV